MSERRGREADLQDAIGANIHEGRPGARAAINAALDSIAKTYEKLAPARRMEPFHVDKSLALTDRGPHVK